MCCRVTSRFSLFPNSNASTPLSLVGTTTTTECPYFLHILKSRDDDGKRKNRYDNWIASVMISPSQAEIGLILHCKWSHATFSTTAHGQSTARTDQRPCHLRGRAPHKCLSMFDGLVAPYPIENLTP